jgi:predicted lipoprotein with Yx(FWY)xxD motif
MKIKLAIAAFALLTALAGCSSSKVNNDTIVLVGLSGPLLDNLYAGKLAGAKSEFTLYKFASDTKGGATSACTGACATTWPPLTVTSSAQLIPPLTATKALATIPRTDISASTLQVTYDGYPLYFYSGDTVVGNTNGLTNTSWTLVAK